MIMKIKMFFTCFLQLYMVCLNQASRNDHAEGVSGSATPEPIIFSLQQSCDGWVIFTWDSAKNGFLKSFGPPYLSSCEITYMNQRSQVARLVLVILHPDIKTIRLSNLDRTTRYSASMTCNDTLNSNVLQFVTGYPCSKTEMKEVEDKSKQWSKRNYTEVFRQPVPVSTAISGYSLTDMILGLFFALCGITIACCFAYYYWKKRRHRQRILLIFGQFQSDPFLALHTPTDQPTTAF